MVALGFAHSTYVIHGLAATHRRRSPDQRRMPLSLRRRLIAASGALATALVAAPLAAQTFVRDPLPRAPGARVSTVTDPGPFTEPGIAIDPRDARHVVGVYQNQASAAWTTDGGAS